MARHAGEREDERSGTSVSRSSLGRFRELLLEEVDGSDEIVLFDEHDEIDHVEVGFAAKATPQIGSLVYGGERFATLRADETDTPVSGFVWPLERGQGVGDGDVVSHLVKCVSSEVPWHARSPGHGK